MRYLIILVFCSLAFCSCYEEEMPLETDYYEPIEEPIPPLDGEAKLPLGGTISIDWYSTSITYAQYWTNSSPASPIFSLWVEKPGVDSFISLVGGGTKCITEYYEYGYYYRLYITIKEGANPSNYVTLKYWETITDY